MLKLKACQPCHYKCRCLGIYNSAVEISFRLRVGSEGYKPELIFHPPENIKEYVWIKSEDIGANKIQTLSTFVILLTSCVKLTNIFYCFISFSFTVFFSFYSVEVNAHKRWQINIVERSHLPYTYRAILSQAMAIWVSLQMCLHLPVAWNRSRLWANYL